MTHEPVQSVDAYAPAQIAARVRETGVAKANLELPAMLALAILAGAFIGLGGALSTLSVAGLDDAYGVRRLVAGLSFSLGLVLVVLAGAELFTGNNLVVMAWASGLVRTKALLRSWTWVYLGNFIGAALTALLVFASAPWLTHGPEVVAIGLRTALVKCQLAPLQAFVLGVLANALVCLAVWLCFGARSATDKILSIVFPITAFVALGFEHSIANMYFLSLGMLLKTVPQVVAAGSWSAESLAALSPADALRNLVFVTLGNILGGAGLVGGMYWFIYLRAPAARAESKEGRQGETP